MKVCTGCGIVFTKNTLNTDLCADCRDVRNADIVRRARTGETFQAIGERYNLTRERVRQIATNKGFPNRKKRRARLEGRIVRYVERNPDAKPADMAAMFDVSVDKLVRIVRRSGVHSTTVRTGRCIGTDCGVELSSNRALRCTECNKLHRRAYNRKRYRENPAYREMIKQASKKYQRQKKAGAALA